MAQNRLTLAMVCVCFLASLSGCMPSVIGTDHEYVLVRTEGTELVVVQDDDPLYEQFDDQVFDDAHLRRLLMVFEHTTESFLATNIPSPLTQTIANRLIIVVDSQERALLHDITVHHNGASVPIELAIGVGHDGRVDLALARKNLPRAMAPLLLELVGLKQDRTHTSASPDAHEVASRSEAFWVAFEAALESACTERHAELAEDLPAGELPSSPRPVFGGPTPEVVATLICRLLQQAGSFYPQRHMLWFASFEPDEIPYAKFLLAVSRMPRHRDVSIQTFVESYAETFPAERASVFSLAEEVLGGDEAAR